MATSLTALFDSGTAGGLLRESAMACLQETLNVRLREGIRRKGFYLSNTALAVTTVDPAETLTR